MPRLSRLQFQQLSECGDYTVSHKEFSIQECNSCNFLFTNPRPSQEEIGAYYQSEEYISHHDESKTLMSKVYKSVRDYTISGKVKMINELVPVKGTILDVGCGTGNFIQACKLDGWKISGTEPDAGANKVASERVGEPVFSSIDDAQLAGKTYDIITLWHVLEHIHLLNETVSWLEKHLNPKGKIIIAVPNPQSHDAQKYRRFWAAYDVPRHLYHFTKRSMSKLMGYHNLEVAKVLPMWFDSFYVGMLSTKYKSKGINLFDSVKTGIVSNIKGYSAKPEETNTSSLIYIITKK